MADPVTAIAMGATIAGGATGAMGSLFGGQAAATAANYQAGVAQMNAQIAQQNAQFEQQKGEAEAQQAGMKGRYQLGMTKAIQGASGIDVNRGSTVNVQRSESEITNMNEATIRNNAARKAWGFEVEGANDQAQAALDRMKASTSKTAGEFGAASSLLSAAGSVSSKWMNASDKGAVPKIGYADIGNFFGFGKDNTDWSNFGSTTGDA